MSDQTPLSSKDNICKTCRGYHTCPVSSLRHPVLIITCKHYRKTIGAIAVQNKASPSDFPMKPKGFSYAIAKDVQLLYDMPLN